MGGLSTQNLSQVKGIPTPTYNRDDAKVGIVHFGLGGFARSHEAMYVDRLMEAGQDLDWGICGVGLMPSDVAMREAMSAQDCLYTLMIRHADGTLEPRVVGSVLDYLFAPSDPEAVLDRLVDPGVRIVSLTVTEGGYLKHPATGEFDVNHPTVLHDAEHPSTPRSAFGFIVEALRRRRAAGTDAFTVLSCDNLQGNGTYARGAVLGIAEATDPELASWIGQNVPFPHCMVDRITPATTDADRSALQERFDLVDQWPVPAEPFTQWIVEDDFVAGRPNLESVGVRFVEDVAPYELMKLRLLNASHQAIAYLGILLDYSFVDEAMEDDHVREFLGAYMRLEAAPTLGELPGIDVDGYIDTLLERFSNPAMRDTLARLAYDGSNRMAGFVLPVLADNLAAGREIWRGATLFAAWALVWEGIVKEPDMGTQAPFDEHAEALRSAAGLLEDQPEAFLDIEAVFAVLGRDEAFREAFVRALASLREVGVHATLEELDAGS